MAWLELLLALALGGLVAHATLRSFVQEQTLRDTADAMRRSGALLIERQNASRMQQQAKGVQQITETVIDAGTSAVRAVHMGIAGIPFGILEAVPATRDATRVVRQTHDVIANAVYGSIKGANRIAGVVARSALGTGQNRRPAEPLTDARDPSQADPE